MVSPPPSGVSACARFSLAGAAVLVVVVGVRGGVDVHRGRVPVRLRPRPPQRRLRPQATRRQSRSLFRFDRDLRFRSSLRLRLLVAVR